MSAQSCGWPACSGSRRRSRQEGRRRPASRAARPFVSRAELLDGAVDLVADQERRPQERVRPRPHLQIRAADAARRARAPGRRPIPGPAPARGRSRTASAPRASRTDRPPLSLLSCPKSPPSHTAAESHHRVYSRSKEIFSRASDFGRRHTCACSAAGRAPRTAGATLRGDPLGRARRACPVDDRLVGAGREGAVRARADSRPRRASVRIDLPAIQRHVLLLGIEVPNAYLAIDTRDARTVVYLPHRSEAFERSSGRRLSARMRTPRSR